MIMHGSLEFICGCMFSGKTEELLRRVRLAEIANLRVQIFKPHRDTRTPSNLIKSRSGQSARAIMIAPSPLSIARSLSIDIINRIDLSADVIAIDEVQFFDDYIVNICENLANLKKRVIIAGLVLDFRGEPFGDHILALVAKCDELKMLTAICEICGESATRTQRIINGVPAKWDDPIYMTGGKDIYQAVCRNHHRIERPLNNDVISGYSVLPYPPST